jgi:hypothetical protein
MRAEVAERTERRTDGKASDADRPSRMDQALSLDGADRAPREGSNRVGAANAEAE